MNNKKGGKSCRTRRPEAPLRSHEEGNGGGETELAQGAGPVSGAEVAGSVGLRSAKPRRSSRRCSPREQPMKRATPVVPQRPPVQQYRRTYAFRSLSGAGRPHLLAPACGVCTRPAGVSPVPGSWIFAAGHPDDLADLLYVGFRAKLGGVSSSSWNLGPRRPSSRCVGRHEGRPGGRFLHIPRHRCPKPVPQRSAERTPWGCGRGRGAGGGREHAGASGSERTGVSL